MDHKEYINKKRRNAYIESLIIFFNSWHLNNKKK